jgi:catechol 2,3-dioxygenase-like lactoylglutathione lyase family enzyme
MNLQLLVYVSDMARSVRFYEDLGLPRSTDGEIDAHWNEFAVGDAVIALHIHDAESLPTATDRTCINLLVPAGSELETLRDRCLERGYTLGGDIQDIGFGRFFWTRDPDGTAVQITEHAA